MTPLTIIEDPVLNPSFEDVKVGDKYVSTLSAYANSAWFYISEVVRVDPISKRFNKPDRVVYVNITTNDGHVVDTHKAI